MSEIRANDWGSGGVHLYTQGGRYIPPRETPPLTNREGEQYTKFGADHVHLFPGVGRFDYQEPKLYGASMKDIYEKVEKIEDQVEKIKVDMATVKTDLSYKPSNGKLYGVMATATTIILAGLSIAVIVLLNFLGPALNP